MCRVRTNDPPAGRDVRLCERADLSSGECAIGCFDRKASGVVGSAASSAWMVGLASALHRHTAYTSRLGVGATHGRRTRSEQCRVTRGSAQGGPRQPPTRAELLGHNGASYAALKRLASEPLTGLRARRYVQVFSESKSLEIHQPCGTSTQRHSHTTFGSTGPCTCRPTRPPTRRWSQRARGQPTGSSPRRRRTVPRPEPGPERGKALPPGDR